MQVFALVDGNSFFASCEKVFRPDLTDRPVIVLSNNDGCVGIAPTKTLAKYCNHLAKHYGGLKGVCNWLDLTPQRQAKALACEPVSEI